MHSIPPLDIAAAQAAAQRQALLTKPPGALGRLEALSIRLAGMTGRIDWLPNRKTVIICAGDHGIAAQGVSAFPQAVTAQMVLNFLADGAAINVLARQIGARVVVVDAGVKADLAPNAILIKGKVKPGTRDFSQEPAMTAQEAHAAIQLGLDVIAQEQQRGLDVVCVGEMGIGNTTAASAILAVLTDHPPHEVTGRGTGLDENRLAHKISIIEQALTLHSPTADNVLEKVGGYEIGAMAGVMIGAAAARIPVVIDGLISTAAALLAVSMVPGVKNYLIAGHRSVEPGHIIALEQLGLEPLLDMGMRLGEGTGAVLALPIIEAAMRTLQEMATFDEAGVSDS